MFNKVTFNEGDKLSLFYYGENSNKPTFINATLVVGKTKKGESKISLIANQGIPQGVWLTAMPKASKVDLRGMDPDVVQRAIDQLADTLKAQGESKPDAAEF